MFFRSLLAALAIASFPALAADIHVNPMAAATADGSRAAPFKTIDAALKAARAGDVILLAGGDYPAMTIGAAFTAPVTITSEVRKAARIRSVGFTASAKNITLSNLSIWRDAGKQGLHCASRSWPNGITVENCDIRALQDSVNYLSWTKEQWLAVVDYAIWLRGGKDVVRGQYHHWCRAGHHNFRRIRLVEGNVIDGFAWDGLRGVSNSVFRNNIVKNTFKVDKTHRDGFQSYSRKTVTGLTVENNVFVSWTHKANSPLRGDMQGISLFDGFYEDLTIKNNFVATTHYNGITVMGARRAVVTGNTVVNLNGEAGKKPWLKITSHKDGRPSENVLVADNRAMSFSGGDAANNVVFSNNTVITNPAAVLARLGPL